MKITRTLIAFLILVAFYPEIGNCQTTYAWTGATSSAWLTTTNWSPATVPGNKTTTTNNDIAYFNNTTQLTAGINMNTQGGTHYMGALNFGTSATSARTVSNSSGTATGTLFFNGVTLNSVANTIIWNQSSATHIVTNGSSTMNLGLNNTSDNVIQTTGTGGITIGSVITGASKNLAITSSGTGVVTLSGVNTYSGVTKVNAGELRLNPSANTSLSGAFTFNGGTLATTGITATRTITFASVNVSDNSTLTLASAVAHTLTFTALGTLTSGKMLTITGWSGASYATGTTSSTGGKVFIGSSASLTTAQLAQIRFYNGTNYYAATQLSTGEIVPTTVLVVTNPGTQTAGVGFSVTVTAKDLDGNARTLTNATGITLTSSTNTIGGTTAGSISAGGSAVTISGVTLTAGTNATITATRSSGDQPKTGTSGTFDVNSANSITTSTITPTTYCAGDNVSVAYTSSGSFSGTFTAQLSDASGSFTTPTAIGTGTSPITATLPTGTTTGTGYRIRVVNNTPAVNGSDNGSNITVYNSTTTVSPTTTQNVSVSTSGTLLSVSEGSSVTSRRWRWSATSGSGYADFSPAEIGSTYTPYFTGAGTYYVVCESTYPTPCGVVTTTSSEVQINVTANTITTSAISGSPFCSGASVSVPFTYSPAGNFPSGGSCTFTAELSNASGSFGSPTNIGSVFSTASGSQTISATIPGGTTTGAGYRIRVTSNSPAVTGTDNGTNLTINTTVTPSVSIVSTPAAVSGITTICAGTSVTFTATPTNGGASPTYQWKVNGVNAGSGGTTFTTTTLTNGQTVTCEMTSNATCPSTATVTSNTITMTVNALVTPAVSIASSPAAVSGVTTVCSGTSVTFTPSATNGGASPTYNWWKNGVGTGTNLGTSATYSSPTLADGDDIACVMTSNATCPSPATATSNTITITNNTPATPTFTANPNTAALGQTGVVYAVTSVAGVTYNWSYTGTGATITGTGNSVTVDYATTATSGNISVTESKSGCTSSAATVAVTVSASAASDIQFNSGSSASSNTNIDYTLYQGTTLTNTGTGASGSIGVMGFTVRDGAGAADADALGTDLSAITFSVTNSANIRNARIFNGSSPVGSVVSVSGGNLTFTGLTGLTTTDGGTLALNLRVTFNSTVTDNQKMVFTVTSASTGSSSSTFAAGNAGGAYSDNNSGNDINRIEVTATKLAFVQQPTTTSISNTMSPSPTVRAIDANNNLDLDYTASVSITSTGTMTGSPLSASASSGLATFSSVVHTVAGTSYTLSATSGSLTGVTSSTFDISTYVNGDWYSITGTGLLWNTIANWQQVISGVLSAPGGGGGSGFPNTGNPNVHILGSMSTNGSRNVGELTIESGGNLTVSASSTAVTKTLVKGGGALTVKALLTNSGTFEVEDNGTVVFQTYLNTNNSAIWNGTENFHPNSTFVINEWGANSSTSAYRPLFNGSNITTNTYNGYTAAFGNIEVDLSSSSEPNSFVFMSSGVTANLAHGNINLLNPVSGRNIAFISSGTVTSGIGGTITVDDLYSSLDKVIFASAGNLTFTVKGDLQLDGATTVVSTSSTAGTTTTVNVEGNINVTAAAVLDFSTTVAGGSPPPAGVIALKGDLTVDGSGLLQNSNTSTKGNINFNGTGNGLTANTTQTIDIASTSANENRYISFNVNNGAFVRLINRDFELGQSDTLRVDNGGIFDFGFSGTTTPLLVKASGSQTAMYFKSLQGSTLKITSSDGITTTTGTGAGIGNVQIPASNRSFNQTATFHYIGQAIQVMGNAITTGSTGKIVIAELASNSLTLTPSNNIAISNGTTLDALGGRLDIRKGIVVETPSATITGTGRLVMTDGVFQTSILSTTLPQLSNYGNYSLTGGTVELNGNGAQTISGAPPLGYYKVAITNAGTKSVTSAFAISKNLTITNGVFDPTNNAITGNAGLTMSGGTFRMSKTSVTLPQLDGIDSVYTITGGTVELYGTSSTQTHSLRGTYNGTPGTNINYYNVELNSTGANVGVGAANVVAQAGFGVAGTMNVNSPACFQLGSGFTITDAGTSTFEVKPGATFKYGGSIATSGATGNVRTDTRIFPTTASYGFVGNVTPQDPGAGLPSSMVNMYMDKTNAGDLVTINQDEEMTNSLAFYKGIVKTNANTMYVSNTSTTAITGGNTSGSDKYVQGRLKRKTDGASTYTFPIGHSSQNAQGFTITPTGTSGSDLLGYLETNSTTPVKSVAYCDLETKTAAGQQIGQGSAGADGALDQVVFNLASPLQWDITNPGGGVTSYNVTVDANGGQDINPVTSAGGTAIRYLLKNGEPGNTGFTTASGGADYPTVGFIACPNQYTLSGMTSFSKFTVNGANAGGTGLPVKLIYFTGKKAENYSQLDWATAIEIDNDKFIVERSGDGVHFESIGSVKGAGNTTVQQNYQWFDKSPLVGWNYYRLKQVDFDGDIEYTNTVAVNFNGDETTPSIIVFPSPSKDFINVQILGTNQIVEAVLYNMIGQAVKNVTPNERMSIEDLPSGEYFIKVIMGNNVVVKQFVKE